MEEAGKMLVLVHGGAGAYAILKYDGRTEADITNGVVKAAELGYKKLLVGGSAVDAVEAAVVELEDNPIFNAGRGSCLTITEQIEMDASIMDGHSGRSGAVGCISGVKNPIKVARKVMEETPHCLLVGDGAAKFAHERGFEKVSMNDLITDRACARLKEFKEFRSSVRGEFKRTLPLSESIEKDTVGAVALDASGHLAYATSTGGITAKMPGRVGDSPLVGCGGFSSSSSSISTTGDGEAFMRTCLAHRVHELHRAGSSMLESVETALEECRLRTGGTGGAIAVDRGGNVGVSFNTDGMAWAAATEGGRISSGLKTADPLPTRLPLT